MSLHLFLSALAGFGVFTLFVRFGQHFADAGVQDHDMRYTWWLIAAEGLLIAAAVATQ